MPHMHHFDGVARDGRDVDGMAVEHEQIAQNPANYRIVVYYQDASAPLGSHVDAIGKRVVGLSERELFLTRVKAFQPCAFRVILRAWISVDPDLTIGRMPPMTAPSFESMLLLTLFCQLRNGEVGWKG